MRCSQAHPTSTRPAVTDRIRSRPGRRCLPPRPRVAPIAMATGSPTCLTFSTASTGQSDGLKPGNLAVDRILPKAREINATIDLLFEIPAASGSRRCAHGHAGCERTRRASIPGSAISAQNCAAPVEKALILETGQTGTDAELAHLAAPAAPRTVAAHNHLLNRRHYATLFRAIENLIDISSWLDLSRPSTILVERSTDACTQHTELAANADQSTENRSWHSCVTLLFASETSSKSAKFYAEVFDLEQVGREDLDIGSAIYMSDGVINLALLNFSGAQRKRHQGGSDQGNRCQPFWFSGR